MFPIDDLDLLEEPHADVVTCPVCGSAGEVLGALGWREHARCVGCGFMWSWDVRELTAWTPDGTEEGRV